MRNIELHKYRTGSVLHGSATPASRLVAQLLVVTLWRSLGTLCRPLGKLLALYLWAGRSALGVVAYLEHLVLHAVGWLSGTAFGRRHPLTRLSRFYFGWRIYIRRWHVGVGEQGRRTRCMRPLWSRRQRAWKFFVVPCNIRQLLARKLSNAAPLAFTAPAAALMAGGVLAVLYRRVRAQFDPKARRRAQFEALMACAPTYEQWKALAAQLRQLEASEQQQQQQQGGKGAGPAVATSPSKVAGSAAYDRKLLHEKTKVRGGAC